MIPKWVGTDRANALLGLVALLTAWSMLHFGLLPTPAREVVASMANNGPNAVGLDQLTRGYYAGLTETDRSISASSPLATAVMDWARGKQELPKDWKASEPLRDAKGFHLREFIPNTEMTYRGVPVRINRWGQRNPDVEKSKPAGAFRICITGESNTMGYGVLEEQRFSNLLEKHLNEKLAGKGLHQRFEVINCAVPGYELADRLYMVKFALPAFHPDLVLVVAQSEDLRTFVHDSMAKRVHQGRDLVFECFRRAAQLAGVKPGDSLAKLRQRFKTFKRVLVEGCFQELARVSNESKIPVAVMLLRLDVDAVDPELHWQGQVAEKCGLPVLPLFDAYEGQGPDMYLHPRDFHASVKAHGRIAECAFDQMMKNERVRALVTK